MGVWLAGVFWDRIHLGAGGEDGLDAERRGVWGDSGHGGGRGAAVAPRDKEEEVGGGWGN